MQSHKECNNVLFKRESVRYLRYSLVTMDGHVCNLLTLFIFKIIFVKKKVSVKVINCWVDY